MTSLTENFTIKSVDLRSALNVSPATFNELQKKYAIKSVDETGKGTVKDIPASECRRILEARGFKYPTPAKVISLMMCKGGVGKTTTSLFLSQRLSSYGAKVLAIDADSQGNLTSAFNLDLYKFDIDEEVPVLVDVLEEKVQIEEAIISVTPNLHLIPSTPYNAILDGKIREKYKNPSLAVSKFLNKVRNKYDYIIIDCAPALNLTNTALICASDTVILPASPDRFSKIGLTQTLDEIRTLENDFNLSIETKIVFTRFDAREYTSLKYLSEIADEHKEKMFKTTIRTASDLKNAITKKEDLFSYKKSNAKEDYDSFTKELMGITKLFEK